MATVTWKKTKENTPFFLQTLSSWIHQIISMEVNPSTQSWAAVEGVAAGETHNIQNQDDIPWETEMLHPETAKKSQDKGKGVESLNPAAMRTPGCCWKLLSLKLWMCSLGLLLFPSINSLHQGALGDHYPGATWICVDCAGLSGASVTAATSALV